MHMMSNSDLIHEEKETFRKSKNIFAITTAIETLTTTEEATVYVRDLEMCNTVELLEDSPAVSLLSKLCERHGYSNEWKDKQ